MGLRKFVSGALLSCFFLFAGEASASNLPGTLKFWTKYTLGQIEPPLVKMISSPQQPKQGDVINAFISVQTKPENVGKVRAYLTAKLDGQDISLAHPSTGSATEELWVARLGAFPISTHTLDVTTLIEDVNESNEIRSQIATLNDEIASLQIQIENESIPTHKVELQSEQAQKIAERVSLEQTLLELRRSVGTDHFTVQVIENGASSNFPHITQVNPPYAVLNAAATVTISGSGFTAQSLVYLSGVSLSPNFIDASTLRITVPANTTAGLKDVEVRVPQASGYQNALSKNGFLAVSGSAPAGLTYALNPAIYTKGIAIQANTPELTQGVATSYSISPALPAGLSFNTTTGAITGTPTAIRTLGNFTITATNHLGSTQAVLALAVNDQLPSSFTYAQNFAVYTKGVAIVANTPVGASNITAFSVSPALPTGLSLDPDLGIISGTPTALSGWNEYVITGSNSSGSVTTTISIMVNDQAPVGLAYETSSASYVKGMAINPNHPSTSGGGEVITYKVSPALPAGLTLDRETGIISGIPAVVSTVHSYTVTATNTGGVSQTTISITVENVSTLAIGAVDFPDVIYAHSTSAQTVSVTNGGPQPITLQSIALTQGTQYAFSSGGTCTLNQVLAPSASCNLYLVFTPDSLGEKDDYLTIGYLNGSESKTTNRKLVGVGIDFAPENLSYPVSILNLVKNIAITPLTATVSGGPVTKYSSLPSLPTGLNLNVLTGEISGTPTVATLAQDYIIVASNSGGSTFTRINISVVNGVPTELSYQETTLVYTKGIEITPNEPINTGGMPIVYSVSPALPAGLSLDANTGFISGTPAQISSSHVYTVSAFNAGSTVTVPLNITVNDQAPINLTYNPGNATYLKGSVITANVPSNDGGAVVSYSITPALASGLSFNASLGTITGTPTQVKETTLYTVTATNTGGSTTASFFITVTDNPPLTLAYGTNPAVYIKGNAITTNSPTSTGGAITGYSVFPPLPIGLSLNPTTGAITGTPTAITSAAIYTLTGTNSGGSVSVDLLITVNDRAPTQLAYSMNPATYSRTVQISANMPSNQGGLVTNYSVSPSLPAGLSLNATLGMITGTPTAITAGQFYTVTASNTGGSTTVSVFIKVNDLAPTNLTYSLNPAVYEKDSVITPNEPSNQGGSVVSYSVNPTLPSGLTLNTVTGVISGTPTAVTAVHNYTITATNTGGSTQVAVSITVNDTAPSSLIYSANPASYIKGTAITSNIPSNSGGTITSYSVSPSLPTGLNLNTATGVISGTPSVASAAHDYVITGSNTGGSIDVTLNITINENAPTNLTYLVQNPSYSKNVAITPNTPSNSGGVITNYSVTAPGLPAGLSIDSSTGVISGTPTVTGSLINVEVVGSNASGSTSTLLVLTINDEPPSNLTYQTANATYSRGQAILSNTPNTQGGAPTGFSVSPNLPYGLMLNPGTGVISGYPLLATSSTSYVVTAQNSGGSTTKTITITVNEPSSGITAIATSDKNTCAINSGALYCWGDNEFGQLGYGLSTATNYLTYAPERTLLTSGVTAVAVSRHHTCAVQNGALKCWGLNNKGQLGNNTITQNSTPQSVIAPLDSGVISVAVGPEYTCAVKTDTSIYCFGNLGASYPQQKTPLIAVSSGGQQVSLGWGFACSLINGGIQCAGANTLGQLGNGTTTSNSSTISFGDVTGVTSGSGNVSAGVLHSCAVQNGLLKCWGDNTFGELGDGTNTSSLTAVNVTSLDPKVAYVSTGGCTTNTVGISQNSCASSGGSDGDHSCAIIDGALKCFGDNGYGELGNGSYTDSNTPVSVSGLSQVTTVAMAARHTCAINNGSLNCWGANHYGQLGNYTTAMSNTPVTIPIVNPTPSAFSYTSSTVTYNVGTTITPNMPALTSGSFSYYKLTGTLPTGLKFDNGSGTIYGTPTAAKVATNYTINGYGSNGDTITKIVNITVAAALTIAPNLTYPQNAYTFYNGLAIIAIIANNSGGAITSCSASPSLPTGLTLSATCGISGTPTVTVNPGQSYTITGTNSSGFSAATIQFTVK